MLIRVGSNPGTWYGADIDDLAIAACAVNSLLWRLGPRMVLCVANTLTEGDWARRAEAQRGEVLQLAATIRRHKLMIKAVRAAQRLSWRSSRLAGHPLWEGDASAGVPFIVW